MGYQGKNVLVTGGLGFIGSNLSIRLVRQGARVTVVDSSVAGCGANPYNLHEIIDRARVIPLGICDAEQFRSDLERSDIIFNLAGEISHTHSMEFPERDLQINSVAQLQFLLACRKYAPGRRVVYASTRQIYGVPDYLPLDETHPINPVDFNGIHKYAASMYHMLLSRTGDIDAVVLRLTNVYGPRMALNIPCQGFLSTFLRRLLLGQPIAIFGDGTQLRDPMYVDDAVEAFLAAGSVEKVPNRVYNVGGPEALPISAIAEMASEAAGGAGIAYQPFPEYRKAIDIGSYYTDSTRIRDDLGWEPRVGFRCGIQQTIDYYRGRLEHYLDPSGAEPTCNMPEHNGMLRRLTFAAVEPCR